MLVPAGLPCCGESYHEARAEAADSFSFSASTRRFYQLLDKRYDSQVKAIAPVLAVLAASAALGCNRSPSSDPIAEPATPDSPSAAPTNASSGASVLVKGSPIPAGPRIPVAEVLAAPDLFAGKPVIVEGNVARVCSRMGCWMELKTEAGKACRVTFNHAFTVPLDSKGKVTVHGVVKSRTVSPQMVQHLEEEGGTFSVKLPDGSAREVAIIADGVELRPD